MKLAVCTFKKHTHIRAVECNYEVGKNQISKQKLLCMHSFRWHNMKGQCMCDFLFGNLW